MASEPLARSVAEETAVVTVSDALCTVSAARVWKDFGSAGSSFVPHSLGHGMATFALLTFDKGRDRIRRSGQLPNLSGLVGFRCLYFRIKSKCSALSYPHLNRSGVYGKVHYGGDSFVFDVQIRPPTFFRSFVHDV